ncbi:MAG: glycosyltransferase family 4 protein [Candidatus Omnitrophica bacterium]|nr:glycosyltransferase family 4 protein [Candidatus Omnitrophota bacterium]
MSKKRLNIAHLHWGFPPIIGGVETHLTIVLPQMVKSGHSVSLLTGAVEGVQGRYDWEGVQIYRTPIMDLNWLYKRGLTGLQEEIFKTFYDFLHTVEPDVIHAHNMHYFSETHARILEELASGRGVPLVLSAHNVWDELEFLELVTHKVNWTHIVAVSHFIKRELIGVGVDDKKITVIHHGVDEDKFRPNVDTQAILRKYPRLKGKHVIFHPARIGLAKGCDVSIKAINLVRRKHPDVMLVLAGAKNIIDWGGTQQKDIAYMVHLINHFGLRDHILIDVYSLDEVKEIYGLSKVCLYPSSSNEPFGLTMLEAMASARPMVVTNMGGMPEVIQDGINGFVVPVRDFESLALRVSELLTDDALRERLGYTGRQMVESQYTKERVTKDILSLYKKLL